MSGMNIHTYEKSLGRISSQRHALGWQWPRYARNPLLVTYCDGHTNIIIIIITIIISIVLWTQKNHHNLQNHNLPTVM